MYAEINTAFQSVKTAIALIKATKELSSSTELLTAMNDVHMKLSDAIASALASQEKQAALAEQVHTLQAQLRDVEDWKQEMNRYQLIEFPDTKALALQLRADMANGEPIHYLCRACAERKKKTTLQPIATYLHCPQCQSNIDAATAPPSPRRKQISGGNESWMG